MKKYHILSLLTLLSTFAGSSHAECLSPGTWRSIDALQGALPGTITLSKSGSAVLHPDGEAELVGTWSAKGKDVLIFTIPSRGQAQMKYRCEHEILFLTYEDGSKQKFSKSKDKK